MPFTENSKAIGVNVLVRIDDDGKTKFKAGDFFIESYIENLKCLPETILSIGANVPAELNMKVGDKIYFDKWAIYGGKETEKAGDVVLMKYKTIIHATEANR
jgi:hypothetical protein